MATREEIKAKILPKVEASILRELVWTDISTAIGSASLADKERIGKAINSNNTKDIGEVILRLVKEQVKFTAGQRADTMLANNTLSLDELDLVL